MTFQLVAPADGRLGAGRTGAFSQNPIVTHGSDLDP
jgi:hypothetical protein